MPLPLLVVAAWSLVGTVATSKLGEQLIHHGLSEGSKHLIESVAKAQEEKRHRTAGQ